MMTSNQLKKSENPSLNQQSDKPSQVASHDVISIQDNNKEELKAPLLEEAKKFKRNTAPNKELTGSRFKFGESEGTVSEQQLEVVISNSSNSQV